MRIGIQRAAVRTATTIGVVGLCAVGLAGLAMASPAGPAADPAPSACRPANHVGTITQDDSTAGHRHYRVTLTATPGTSPCTLQGVPADLYFLSHGVPQPVRIEQSPAPGDPVEFGPGHPVTFDIQVPNGPNGVDVDSAAFTLRTPDNGVIPGESTADGPLRVQDGTQIGPVTPA